MKRVTLTFLVLLVIIAVGCDYDVPLLEKQGLPLDPSLIGAWETFTNQKEKEKLIISRHSQSEYSIRLFSENNEGTYFLAYPIKVANISCIQLIGTDERFTPVNESEKYLVISYVISSGNLIIKKLNTDIVSSELKNSIELRKIFLQNKDNKNLFSEVDRFKKVNPIVSKQNAQKNNGSVNLCNLQLKVVEVNTGVIINSATGTAINSNSKSPIKAVLKKGLLYFAKLKVSDSYTISITKAGFKRTIYNRVIKCADENDTVIDDLVYMQKGTISQTFSPVISRATELLPRPPNSLLPDTVSHGNLNNDAIFLAQPVYTELAKKFAKLYPEYGKGPISVRVWVDENGNVILINALSGNSSLRPAGDAAAKASKFNPVIFKGKLVQVIGVIIFPEP